MKILVVDDERSLNQLVATNLMLEGYEVESAYDGAEALRRVEGFNPDLMLLDVMMPDIDGFEVLKQVRSYSSMGVIMLTARGRTEERVAGLRLGADDYLPKPFSIDELLARIEAVLRRRSQTFHEASFPQSLKSDTVECLVAEHRVLVSGREVVLQNLEFKLLMEFMRARNRVLPHDYLLMSVWTDEPGTVATLRVTVGKLRSKLKEAAGRDLVETVYGVGYKFVD